MKRSSLIASIVFMASWLQAHSIHQSTAEAEYNPTTKRLEVSLKVFINDLEVALIRQCEHEMKIEKTPSKDFDIQIQICLARNFLVADAAGKVSQIKWLGRTLDPESAKSDEPTVTLFFEVSVPDGLEGCTIQHTLFGDMFKDQLNLLFLRWGKQKVEMQFTHKDMAKKLSFSVDRP